MSDKVSPKVRGKNAEIINQEGTSQQFLSFYMQEKTMASNFRIDMHQKRDMLRLTLRGDFDGGSACELIDAIRENLKGGIRIVVDTDSLKDIHPFGNEVLRRRIFLWKSAASSIRFTGANAFRIMTADVH